MSQTLVDPVSVVKDVYAAFGRGDVPGVLDLLTPDVVWEVVGRKGEYPMYGRRHGLEGAREFFDTLGATEDLTKFEPQSFHASGDMVFVQGRIAGSVRRTGRNVETDWLQIFTVRDGRVAAFKEFYDTAQVTEAYRGG